MLRWVAPVVLATVFAFAGGAKAADVDATADGFRGLGLPRPRRLVLGVIAAEVVTAALLVALPVAGGVLALVLLAGFSALLARRLRAGSTAPCRCFGGVRERPVAWTDVGRNGLLAALAAVTLLWPPT